jgi:hypothetical protein
MCFSEQYVFVLVLGSAGMMCWMVGMQIIFVNKWNVFDDPATCVILCGSLLWCRATHSITLVVANYLRIWKVDTAKDVKQLALDDLFADRRDTPDGGHAPPAPRGSLHEGWEEPSPRNAAGLERYCNAFLQENRLWLQLAFAEMSDKRLLTQHREALLRSLAQLLEEIEPEHYAPDMGQGPRTGLEFAADPVTHLTIAAGELQRRDYQNSTAQELVTMWRRRAKFMLYLSQKSANVKLDNVSRKNACEICGRRDNLVVTPIYTLTHLASSYRQQRDMSPLWNMVFWKHFYKTFTPTCTTCEDCKEYYHSRNQNVPVDEKRFRRLQEREKMPYEVLAESQYDAIPLSEVTVKVLHMWLEFTKLLAAGEDPRDFLPSFGIEGRTMQEIRTERLEAAKGVEDDDTGLPPVEEVKEDEDDDESSEVDEDDPDSVARHKASKLARLRKAEISDDEEDDDGLTGFEVKEPPLIGWAARSLAGLWLHKARQSLAAPQLQTWSQPGQWSRLPPPGAAPEGLPPSLPSLPPPGAGPSQVVNLPPVPPAPTGGSAAVTGAPGMPPPPAFAPPPAGQGRPATLPPPPPYHGGADRGGGTQS